MTKLQTFENEGFLGLLNAEALYFLLFANVLGQNIWQSFVGGVIAHKTLSRQQFGLLQAQTFPTYFLTTLTYTSVLLSMWIYKNLDTILSNLTSPSVPAVTQTYCLLFIVGLSLLNWLYIGPTTHGLMAKRHKLERAEGKAYSDPGVSSSMKTINSQFSKWHGISSFANLFVIIALIFHGLWFANFGLSKAY